MSICLQCGNDLGLHHYGPDGVRRCRANGRVRTFEEHELLMLDLPDQDDPILRDETGRLVRASQLAQRYRKELTTRKADRFGRKK